jgi:hypothetical protein
MTCLLLGATAPLPSLPPPLLVATVASIGNRLGLASAAIKPLDLAALARKCKKHVPASGYDALTPAFGRQRGSR